MTRPTPASKENGSFGAVCQNTELRSRFLPFPMHETTTVSPGATAMPFPCPLWRAYGDVIQPAFIP